MQVINGFDGYDYSRMLGWTALSLPFGLAVGDRPNTKTLGPTFPWPERESAFIILSLH